MANKTGTDKNVTDTMKKKNKQIIELSDEDEDEDEKE